MASVGFVCDSQWRAAADYLVWVTLAILALVLVTYVVRLTADCRKTESSRGGKHDEGARQREVLLRLRHDADAVVVAAPASLA
jgi:hypothetical protein